MIYLRTHAVGVTLLALTGTLWVTPATAQNVPAAGGTSATPLGPVFRRAQQSANDGDTAAARAIIDSVLASIPIGLAEYPEALFWHASFAASGEVARRDYLRLAVEFSLSPRAGDALVRLAQLELTTGNRAGAKKFLERLALEHADEPSRATGAYWMGRVLLDEGTMAAGCASLAVARAHVASADAELSNQIAYYARQCVDLRREADTARAGTAIPAESSSARRGPAWSAQVAAYATRQEAERMAARLKARGYDVRVTRETPFRVRIGQFPKRADAAALAQKLQRSKIAAIVVESEQP